MSKKDNFLQQVEKVAELARLSLSPEKKVRYAKEIEDVLEHFEDINHLEVKQLSLKEEVNHYALKKNVLRQDKVEGFSLEGKKIIKKSFPESTGDFLKVKTIF